MEANDIITSDYKRLVNNLPGIVYRSALHADGSRTLIYVSEGCYQLIGISARDLLKISKNPLMHFIYPADYDYVIDTISKAIQERKPYKMTYRMKFLDSNVQWILDQGSPCYDEDLYPIGVEGIILSYVEDTIREIRHERDIFYINTKLQQDLKFGDLVGESDIMLNLYKNIKKAAKEPFSLVILGPTDAGKEMVAKEIVNNSNYKSPFITVNCGAIPYNLMESMFFGHAKGAFTGAFSHNIGYIEQANGGTLFLDEVAELSLEMQVKLLRVLEIKSFSRIGEQTPRSSNFRLISATNKNLELEVKEKRMREDFYYRINVLSIHVPSLQERSEDIPLLADHFCQILAKKSAEELLPITLRTSMQKYSWPGNIRELRNFIERYIAFGEVRFSNFIPHDNIFDKNKVEQITEFESIHFDPACTSDLKTSLQKIEYEIIEKKLAFYKGNKQKTADSLKISVKSLYRKLAENKHYFKK